MAAVDLYTILQNPLGLFLLVLTRVSGIFILSPFLGSRNIPVQVRISAAVAITLVLYPVVLEMTDAGLAIPETLVGYALAVLTELFIGWMIGFAASLTFTMVHMAGQILDMQVGFGMVNVVDPTSGQQVPIIGSFKYNLALIAFLVSNGHHLLLSGLFESFRLVPVLGAHLQATLVQLVMDFTAGIYLSGLKIALPVVAAILLTEVALGVLARTMPQMNIFVVGIPLKICVGLFILMMTIPFFIMFMDVAFNEMYGNIFIVLRNLQ